MDFFELASYTAVEKALLSVNKYSAHKNAGRVNELSQGRTG